MQRDTFVTGTGAMRPLRAEPRHSATHDAEGQIRSVQATSGGLIRATLGSALAAGAILVFAWLPAEYGIDPTGVGRVLGLTEMGEIKQQLYAEAEADAALAAQAGPSEPPAAPVPTASPAPPDPALIDRLTAIETQLAAIAAIVGATPVSPDAATPADAAAGPAAPAAVETGIEPVMTAQPAEPAAPTWRDEVSYTLAPTEGIEVKLVMEEGAIAAFEWTANGGVLNYDTHGDGGGQRISYEQGRGVPGQEGELVAAFSGNHGWFWRNRTDAPVTVTLRARGDYTELKAP
jgi:hypothetical protein